LENSATKKEKVKLTPEEMFNIFLECSTVNAPVKEILERYHLKPWNLVEIRKRIKEASLEALENKGKRRYKSKPPVTFEQFQIVSRELEQTKDALAAVGHELSLLKKRVS